MSVRVCACFAVLVRSNCHSRGSAPLKRKNIKIEMLLPAAARSLYSSARCLLVRVCEMGGSTNEDALDKLHGDGRLAHTTGAEDDDLVFLQRHCVRRERALLTTVFCVAVPVCLLSPEGSHTQKVTREVSKKVNAVLVRAVSVGVCLRLLTKSLTQKKSAGEILHRKITRFLQKHCQSSFVR